ncbi:MAG: hypothetical protein K0S31_431 [Sphingobacterium multivorum]|jgi:hypothetical protein|nr:hypothetical protein [Sphingobacterium multivorum]
MKVLVKTFAAAALIAVSTFAMAAEGPGEQKQQKKTLTFPQLTSL